MARNVKLQKPDVGGTMSKKARAAFAILLIIFIGMSVYMSFSMISRKTYEYKYSENYEPLGKAGWVFDGFNGNSATETLTIDKVMEKVNGDWIETENKIIAVDNYTLVSDEYVKYIYIGPDVEYIADQAFVYCKQLRAFYVDENNPNYVSVNGILYTKDMTELISYPICHCTQVVIDDVKAAGEVTNIGRENVEKFTVKGVYISGDEAKSTLFTAMKNYIKDNYSGDFDFFNEFREFSLMMDEGVYAPYIGTYYQITEKTADSITVERYWTCDEKYEIPEGVTKIDAKAFYKCDRLREITVPSTVKSIGEMAFFKCYGVSLITLPDGLEFIGNDAFSYCENMRYAMYIPASVKEIGHHAFYKCNEDMDFYMGAKSENDLTLGGRWQPRNDNKFKAKDPLWGKARKDCDDYNNGRYAEDAKALAEAEAQAQTNTSNSAGKGEMDTKLVAILMAVFFVPGFLYIALQVIRNAFKDDFLMTKRGKARLQKIKEEKEMIHQSYLKDAAEDTDTDESEVKQDE